VHTWQGGPSDGVLEWRCSDEEDGKGVVFGGIGRAPECKVKVHLGPPWEFWRINDQQLEI
jgi:hypothetical protein